ncbi:MAG: glycosyltransferase [Rhodobacteraceae bacterium]|nr:glycosyltransferase [Paracoccaceae bacterium]
MSLTVSIVIVSRHRPELLRRCLIGISQLDYEPFEIVIVADPATCTGLRSVPQAVFAKIIPFEPDNIAAARNAGIDASAGEIVAFIDDDSVPEPTWLKFLMAPFSHIDTAAAGGFVRGRNGISWQFQASTVDREGRFAPIGVDPGLATILIPTQARAIRTPGTNMAARRSVLQALGGFDPRFKCHLDEVDFNLRLAAQNLCTAIVPMAEVHNMHASNKYRRDDGAPIDLGEVGASWAVFLAKHCSPDLCKPSWERVQREERERACAHMVRGQLEPRDVGRLMSRLRQGYAAGQTRGKVTGEIASNPTMPFQPSPPRHDFRSIVLSGYFWQRNHLRNSAKFEANAGSVVTLILLSPTAFSHHVWFDPDGYWQHTGGIFGKTERSQPLISFRSFRRRVHVESDRVGKVRSLR